MMTSKEFIEKLNMALNSNTLYILGCFGAPMTDKNKERYTNNRPENGKEIDVVKGRDAFGNPIIVKERTKAGAEKREAILACSIDTFGFDCVCLGKGIIWGWCGDINRPYGGAGYACNGMSDCSANGMISKECYDVSTDFSTIVPGEVVWMDGHVGYYVGNGEVIECTDRWERKVLKSYLGNLGFKTGHYRTWVKHGKLKVIDYTNFTPAPVPKPEPVQTGDVGNRTYIVKKGDTLSKIAKSYNTTVDRIVADNLKSHKSITPNHIVTGWKLKV